MQNEREPTPEEIAANVSRANAEARKFEAETRKADAEALKAEIERQQAEISLRTNQRQEAKTLAANEHHRVYTFTQDVSDGSVRMCMDQLNVWRRDLRNGTGAIEIVFSSHGGDVVSGLALFDFIQILRREGHHITTGALGMAASMAGILLQAGDVPWCGREAWVLIHQVQAGMLGSWGELQDRMKWLERVQSRILDIFASRCKEAGENGTTSHPFSRRMLERNWTRTDWWLDSDTCLKGGIVDEIK